MRFLSLFFRLCLHVAIAYSLFKRQNIDGGLFDSTLDSTLFSNQPSVAALGPLDQTLTPDYGLFSNGNLDLAQSTEPDFLALGMGCDTSNANGIQMFDKRRREATCQTDTPGDSVDGSVERNLESAFTKAQTALLFKSESKICPPEIFGPSNIPVCSKDESMNISLLGLPWANLWDVDRTLANDLLLVIYLQATPDQSL